MNANNKIKLRAVIRVWAQALKALFDRPLIWLFPFYAAGICLGWQSGPGGGPGFLTLAAALALAVLLLHFLPSKGSNPCYIFLLTPAVLFLGWGLTARALDLPSGPGHLIFYTDHQKESGPVILGGYVLEGSGGRPDQNFRLLLDCRELLVPGDEGPLAVIWVQGRARISVGGPLMVETGDYVRLPVILRRLESFKNPGSDTYEKYWGARGYWVGGFVKSPALVSSWPGLGRAPLLSRWRSRAAEFIEGKVAGPAAGIMAAQLVGRRNAVDPESEETFRSLGLSHLLAVSGLHLGVWYGLCFVIFRLMLKRILPPGRRIGADLAAAGAALIPAIFYAALVGAASPVIRAAVMIAAVVLALLAWRRSDSWNVLAAAAWILLLVEPYRLFTASFQLSFVATAAMLAVFTRRPGQLATENSDPDRSLWFRPVNPALIKHIYRRLRGRTEPAPQPGPNRPAPGPSFFRQALWAALAGTFGTAPLVIWHFGRLPLAGIWANVLFTAILSTFVLIPGLAAMALLPLSPGLAAWPLSMAGHILNGLMPLLTTLAGWAGPGLMIPAPGPWLLAAWYLASWVWLRSHRPRTTRLTLAAIVLIIGFSPGLIKGQGDQGVLRFTILDVGQGSAVHLNFPDGRQMLVDGGGSYGFDPGEALIVPYLQRQGLSRLDVVALTHPDQDHLKGLLKVIEFFPTREIWSVPWPKNISPSYQEFLSLTEGLARAGPDDLHRGRPFGPVMVSALWPPKDYQWPPENPGGNWVNDHGLVLKIEWGELSFLITGDIGPAIERKLANLYGPKLKSDVLLAPHHGSRSGMTPEFLSAVRPAWVVFSAGRHNSFGLPHPEPLARALEAGAGIRRTDLEGAVIFEAREIDGRVGLTKP